MSKNVHKKIEKGIGRIKYIDKTNNDNSEKNSMGVSGLGGKEGMYILSKKPNKEPTTVVLFTYQEGGEYLLFSRDLFTYLMRSTAAITRRVLRCAESVAFKTECSPRKRNQK
jgi:hypothetical protein